MTKNLLTLGQVEQLVPRLQAHFQEMLYHKKETAQCSNQLRRLGTFAQLVGKVPIKAPPEVHELQAKARYHYREFKEHLLDIENLGGDIKDLELGRVDFTCHYQGTERTLTWQLGVTDGVYLQPLEESLASSVFRTASMQLPAADYSF